MYKNLINIFVAIFLTTILNGCSLFENDDVIPPAKLTNFPQKLAIKTIWENKNNGGAGDFYLKLTPALVDNKVFTVSYRGNVKAIDFVTGRSLWEVQTRLPLTSGVAADSGLLFIGTDAGRLIALSQTNGKIVWQASIPSEILAIPAVHSGKVIVRGTGGQLIALDAFTGKELWRYAAEREPGLILRGSSAPRIADGLVINGFANGELVALNLNSGKVEWKQAIVEPTGGAATDRMTDIDAEPVIADGIIYCATYQGKIAAITLHGRVLWEKPLSAYSDIAVGADTIYTSDSQGLLIAFSRKTGEILWQQNALIGRNLSAPVLYHENIVVGDVEGYVHWLSANDGRFLARVRVDRSEIIAPPIVTRDGILVMTKSGKLVKLR